MIFSLLSSFSTTATSSTLNAARTLISTFRLRNQILQLSSGGFDSKKDVQDTLAHIKRQAAAEPECYPYAHLDIKMC